MEIYIHVGAAHRLQNWFQTINLNFLLSPSKGKKENAQVKFQVRFKFCHLNAFSVLVNWHLVFCWFAPCSQANQTMIQKLEETWSVKIISYRTWYWWPFFSIKLLHPLPFKNSSSHRNSDSDIWAAHAPLTGFTGFPI